MYYDVSTAMLNAERFLHFTAREKKPHTNKFFWWFALNMHISFSFFRSFRSYSLCASINHLNIYMNGWLTGWYTDADVYLFTFHSHSFGNSSAPNKICVLLYGIWCIHWIVSHFFCLAMAMLNKNHWQNEERNDK